MPRVNFDEWAEARCRKCCWIGNKDRLIAFRTDTKARCPKCLSADVEVDERAKGSTNAN